MSNDAKTLLKNLFKALDDKPLEPDDPFYLPYVKEELDDPVKQIAFNISMEDAESLHLVSGQRGTGKSTELRRLRDDLTQGGCTVLYINMLEYVSDSQPVEISDFLLAVTIGLSEAAQEAYNIDAIHENFWQKTLSFLSALELDGLSLKGGVSELSGEIKLRIRRDSSFKQRLQAASRGHISQLVEQTHEFIGLLVKAIRDQDGNRGKQVVVILDSFEQVRGSPNNLNEVHQSVVELFSTQGRNLRLPHLHMVMTIPPYLTTAAPGFFAILDANPPIAWPNIHVCTEQGDADEHGIKILTDIIAKRSTAINQLFRPEDLRELAILSGGELRILFSLVKECLSSNGARMDKMELPTPPDVLKHSINKVRRGMLPIPDDDVRKLAYVADSKQVELGHIEELPELARLLDFSLIINYRNGDDWYDIHPLISDYVTERMDVLTQREQEQSE